MFQTKYVIKLLILLFVREKNVLSKNNKRNGQNAIISKATRRFLVVYASLSFRFAIINHDTNTIIKNCIFLKFWFYFVIRTLLGKSVRQFLKLV